MAFYVAAHQDPPETVRLRLTDGDPIADRDDALQELLGSLHDIDPDITYRPDLFAVLVTTDYGVAIYSLTFPSGIAGTRVTLASYLVSGSTTTNDAESASAAAKDKLVESINSRLSDKPKLAAHIRLLS